MLGIYQRCPNCGFSMSSRSPYLIDRCENGHLSCGMCQPRKGVFSGTPVCPRCESAALSTVGEIYPDDED